MASRDIDLQPSSWITWGSPAVNDGLRSLGLHFQAMDAGITGLSRQMAVAGPAYTVRCYPGATWALEQALEDAKPGDVLVVDGGGHDHVILMGGLMSRRMKARGLAGAIVDGAVRDVNDICNIGFPVFSRHICPRAGTHAQIGEKQTVICCGRTPVHPGHWIVADDCGVVVIPQARLNEAAQAARAIYEKEQSLAHHLEQGLDFPQAIAQYQAQGGHTTSSTYGTPA